MMFTKEIDDYDFESKIDENKNIFAMLNSVYDFEAATFRKSTPLDFVYTNTGWEYKESDAVKYLPDVKDFFGKLFPFKEEHDVVVAFIASLIHGHRLDKKFLALTDNRNGNNGKSTLINLLSKFFGDYTKTSNKFLLKGSFDKDKDSHDGGLEPLKGKRILICDELKKNMRLDEGLIKNLAGGEYKVEGRRLGKSEQFRFCWQAGIIMIFNEGDCPKFDATDNAFMERMVIVPMRSKFVVSGSEDPTTFTYSRDSHIGSKFILWRSALLKFFIQHARSDGLTGMSIPASMNEWKTDICNENNILKDWLFGILKEDNNQFVQLSELKDRYRQDFPYEKVLKNKDIERMINSLFNNKGVYLKEQHKYLADGKRHNVRNVYTGYGIK
jgi:phage/plasmid-associated DNA primase